MNYYNASFVMRSKDPATLRIIDIWTFKSSKSHKRYIVEVEHFTKHFLGLKFYWKGVAESKNRYSLLTNDYEPRTIVMSCIRIMLDYCHDNGDFTIQSLEHEISRLYEGEYSLVANEYKL